MNKFLSIYLPTRVTQNTFLYTLWGTFLIVLTSQLSIPLEPVPITMQTFGVMLVAITFERKAAINSILAYLALGAAGAPVFANFTGGIPYLVGPTGGYLFGFLLAVLAMTTLSNYLNNQRFLDIALNCLVGTAIILASGVIGLSTFVGLDKAIAVGLMPFILPGLIKAVLLAVTVRYLKIGRI